MTDPSSLPTAFRAGLGHAEAPPRGARVVVAVSGGLDSCVLLHLLHFEARGHFELTVAHFDHRTRAESGGDAQWVKGLCVAWGLQLGTERAASELRSEEAARDARYAFLERIRRQTRCDAILTAHHADDQAETVLFRVLRGTGLSGLAGIPRSRDGTIFRPLLDHWREDLEAYALRVGLGWRVDASNAELTVARNAIRHRLLPEAERLVAPRSRRALVRLAKVAAAEESAWAAILEDLLAQLDVEQDDDEVSLDREGLLALDPAVRSRVLRGMAQRNGLALDELGTRSAVEFSSSGRSGGGIDLGSGLQLRRRLGRLVLVRPPAAQPDRPLTIAARGPGRGEAWLGGKCVPVSWGAGEGDTHKRLERLDVSASRLPIVVRARLPGDRIRLPGGTKKLKKLFLDARIPDDRRERMAVVVDSEGEVLWVPGVARSVAAGEGEAGDTLTIGIG